MNGMEIFTSVLSILSLLYLSFYLYNRVNIIVLGCNRNDTVTNESLGAVLKHVNAIVIRNVIEMYEVIKEVRVSEGHFCFVTSKAAFAATYFNRPSLHQNPLIL